MSSEETNTQVESTSPAEDTLPTEVDEKTSPVGDTKVDDDSDSSEVVLDDSDSDTEPAKELNSLDNPMGSENDMGPILDDDFGKNLREQLKSIDPQKRLEMMNMFAQLAKNSNFGDNGFRGMMEPDRRSAREKLQDAIAKKANSRKLKGKRRTLLSKLKKEKKEKKIQKEADNEDATEKTDDSTETTDEVKDTDTTESTDEKPKLTKSQKKRLRKKKAIERAREGAKAAVAAQKLAKVVKSDDKTNEVEAIK